MKPSIEYLSRQYDACCDLYRGYLCNQWGLDRSLSWWIPSEYKGETLALNDCEYSISMTDVRIFVENEIPFEEFEQWWDYNVNATPNTEINAYAWFVKGDRPKQKD